MPKIDLMMEDWKQLQTLDKTSIRFNYFAWMQQKMFYRVLSMLYRLDNLDKAIRSEESRVFQGLDKYVKN